MTYNPSPTGLKFHESDAYLKLIMGPYGSGKSYICAMDVLINSLAQHSDGIPSKGFSGTRWSRWGVIRNTYSQLIRTTRKSLLEVFPKDTGYINQGGNTSLSGHFRIPLPDGTVADIELDMWAAQTDGDLEKLKSANFTAVWLNEADLLPETTLQFCLSRIGRFPNKDLGGIRWSGVLMDFNVPPVGHHLWQYETMPSLEFEGTERAVAFFKQPPAVFETTGSSGEVSFMPNEGAENLENLEGGADYYNIQIAMHMSKGEFELIRERFCLIPTPRRKGKAVFSNFSMERHVSKVRLEPIAGYPVIGGYDTSGFHPAVVLLQQQNGQWCVLDELYADNVGLEEFVESALSPLLQTKYSKCEVSLACDPSNTREQKTARTPAEILREDYRIDASVHSLTNAFEPRRQAVSTMLNRLAGGLLISPHCELLIEAMAGGYHYKKLAVSGVTDEIYSKKPVSNVSDHIADALQYAALRIQRYSSETALLNSQYSANIKRRTKRRGVVV